MGKESVLLYCESININNDQSSWDVYFDFHKDTDLSFLSSKMGLSNEVNLEASLMRLKKIKFKNEIIYENRWYEFNEEDFLKYFTFSKPSIENNLILVDASVSEGGFFDSNKYYTQILYFEDLSDVNTGKMKPSPFLKENKVIKGETELIVHNVGVGNCNELINNTENLHLFYDLGADKRYTNQQIEDILDNINFDLFESYICTISHWDVDHFQMILHMSDNMLQKMDHLIHPQKVPSTKKCSQAISRLKSLRINIITLPHSPRTVRNITLGLQNTIQNIQIYRSSDSINRRNLNQSGIVLLVNGISKKAVLGADHHYSQLLNGIFSHFTNEIFEFVIPHHGGYAGLLDQNKWNQINFSTSILSTMSGHYRNLPNNNTHHYWANSQNNTNVCTRNFFCMEDTCQYNYPQNYRTTL